MNILGVPIDNISREETLDCVCIFLDEPKFHRIATVNPEFLLLAEKDPAFRQSLLNADLRIADGFGIVIAGLLRGERITRFPGADLMEEILRIANEKHLSVFLAIRKDGLSSYEEVRSAILKKYPNILIGGENMDVYHVSSIKYQVYEIHNTKYDILFCNFGAPTQELFLSDLKNNPGNIRLAMGVGGSFDYLTGKVRRAPQWLRMIGLEWLWRLILQPNRWKRIWNAAVVFPVKVVLMKFKSRPGGSTGTAC